MNRYASAAAFPLGGIGTGNVSIGARGELRDWELTHHPDRGNTLPFTFFAIRAKTPTEQPVTRVLEARLPGPHDGEQGYAVPLVGGLPRLRDSRMNGEYPLMTVDFDDDRLPVTVSLTAFTPMIPLDSDDSGIPGAVLRYRVHNPGPDPVDVTIVGSLSNPIGARAGSMREFPEFDGRPAIERRDRDGLYGLHLTSDLPSDDLRSGTLSLVSADPAVTVKRQWLVGFWQDGVRAFWDDLVEDGLLADEPVFSLDTDLPTYLAMTAGPDAADDLAGRLTRLRVGSLGIVHRIPAGAEQTFEFVLTWCFPHRPGRWHGHIIRNRPGPTIRNHYATRFADSWAVARYLTRELPRLEAATRAFHRALYGSDLDPAVLGALGANLAMIRSTTCFRIADGTFVAWEGSYTRTGHCEGTCTHVWSYAQALAHLYPDLERSARRAEFLLETDADGAMQFRGNQVLGGPSWGMRPAADGQLGTIVRLYREWRICGDDAWLRTLWPAAERALRYAVREWDCDGDGMLDTPTHNTYDIEFHGSEPLSNIYLLAALAAGARMAEATGGDGSRYRRQAARSAATIDARLFNGEYYQQLLPEGKLDEHRYQLGSGVLSDQLLGQCQAHLVGLGHLLPPEHVRSALEAVYRYNFRADLSEHESTQRAFALNDEGGLLLASWPHGGRPRIPFIYSDEVWTGVEYQVATHLVFEGMTEQALRLVRAARDRHDGIRRNPWSETECGHHYARSLAAWGLLLAFSGVRHDIRTATLSVSPADNTGGAFLFTTATGWGRLRVEDPPALSIALDHGHLDLRRVEVRGHRLPLPTSGLRLRAGDTVHLPPAEGDDHAPIPVPDPGAPPERATAHGLSDRQR